MQAQVASMPRLGGGPANSMLFNFTAAAKAKPGTTHRAGAGIDCPCCVDQGPDADLMF